jgi:F0F1-type ATP synthase membrane subunit b/b'
MPQFDLYSFAGQSFWFLITFFFLFFYINYFYLLNFSQVFKIRRKLVAISKNDCLKPEKKSFLYSCYLTKMVK